MLAVQPRLAAHQVHAALADLLQRGLPELLADPAGPRRDGRVHHLRRRGQGDPVHLLLLKAAEVGGGLPEGLGRRAAAGDHGAADGIPLHQRHRVTQIPAELGGRLTGRARADHHHVVTAAPVVIMGRHD